MSYRQSSFDPYASPRYGRPLRPYNKWQWLGVGAAALGLAIIALAAAVIILGAGVWFYRRRDKSDSYGPQGAVIMFVVAAIMGVHALGGFDYRPSQGELDAMKERAQ